MQNACQLSPVHTFFNSRFFSMNSMILHTGYVSVYMVLYIERFKSFNLKHQTSFIMKFFNIHLRSVQIFRRNISTFSVGYSA